MAVQMQKQNTTATIERVSINNHSQMQCRTRLKGTLGTCFWSKARRRQLPENCEISKFPFRCLGFPATVSGSNSLTLFNMKKDQPISLRPTTNDQRWLINYPCILREARSNFYRFAALQGHTILCKHTGMNVSVMSRLPVLYLYCVLCFS
jgi:hypothetical protein